jgi:hypothetical protein
MKNRSRALLALAALAAASAATAMATEPPLKTLPSQQEIWITGTIERGNGEYAPGGYTTLRLDRRSASPCNNKAVTDILLGKAGVPEPLLLLPYLGQRVAVRGACHLSGYGHPFYADAGRRVSHLLTAGTASPDRQPGDYPT